MKNQRVKQTALSILIVLSLFVSSVSACACAHQSQPRELSHCQSAQTEQHHASEHSHNAPEISHHEDDLPELEISVSLSEDACCCVSSAPSVSAKIENIKIEKQKSVAVTVAQIELSAASLIAAVKTVDFAAPFYLSDSFHNLTPGRAPPLL